MIETMVLEFPKVYFAFEFPIMATETVAPDYTSTDEKIEEAANGEETVCLADENEENHAKAEDAQGLFQEIEYLELEASFQEASKPEPVVTEVQERVEEQEKESQEKPQKAELPNIVAVHDLSPDTNEILSNAIENPEPVVTEFQEKSQELEKELKEKAQEVEQLGTVAVSGVLAKTNEKQSDATENCEPVVTEVQEKSEELEKELHEKPPNAEKPKTVEVSDFDTSAETKKTREAEFDAAVSKETTNYEARPTETEKPGPMFTEIKENPSEPEKQSFGEEAELVESKETSDEIIKEPILLNEENTDKVDDTSVTGSSAQVSSNEVAQAVTENLVESSPAVAQKVVQEACNNEVQEVSKQVDGILKDPEQEAKAELEKGEIEYSTPISVEEKNGAIDGKKQQGAPDERAAVDNEKQGQPEIKVNEGATTFTEQVGEVLASKMEEKTQSVKTFTDIAMESPAKSAQKQSNSVLKKVKKSLVKAKKAITGKSPTSKTVSTEAKGDINVK